MVTLNTVIDGIDIDISYEDEDTLTEERAFVEVEIGENLFCRFEVFIINVKGPDGKHHPVARLIEVSGNFEETKN